MAFETFDLGRAYSDAARIKALEAETVDRTRRTDLYEKAVNQREEVDPYEQQLKNTKLLNMAAAAIETNPAAAGQWLPVLQKAGVVRPDFNLEGVAPEQLQAAAKQIRAETEAALRSLDTPAKRDVREVGDQLVEVGQEGAPQVIYTAPDKPKAPEPVNSQLVQRPAANGMVQDFAFDPRSKTMVPVGQPYEPEKKAGDDPSKLRKEFNTLESVKTYKETMPLLVSARNAPDNGYGDLQLIYTAGKLLDPGSVVREGEVALAIAAGSPVQRALGITQFNIEKGGRLTAKAREQLLGMLAERVEAYRAAYEQDRTQYERYATEQGLTPQSIIGAHPEDAYKPRDKQPAAPAGTPKRLRFDEKGNQIP